MRDSLNWLDIQVAQIYQTGAISPPPPQPPHPPYLSRASPYCSLEGGVTHETDSAAFSGAEELIELDCTADEGPLIKS